MSDKYELIYIYNNATYSITDTKKVHELLKNDSAFFEDYLMKNTTAPILLSINETENASGQNNFNNNNVTQDESFSWSTKSTKLFLAAYSERKLQFRDPKVKKRRLWQEIVGTLKEHGYNVSEDILDRKMRNMKRTYKTIKENNKKSTTGRGLDVSWEYFDTFEEIFANDKTINPNSTLESTINIETVVPTTEQSIELSVTEKENENFSTNISIINESSSILPLSEITNIQQVFPDNCVSPSTSSSSTPLTTKANKSSLYNQRKKQMDLEQKRIQAINDLKESLNESNRIQKERNELIKELLLSQAK